MENIYLNLSVKLSGYFGDWQSAIDETYCLANELKVPCKLNYANQYEFIITPQMTLKDIDNLKKSKIVIAI